MSTLSESDTRAKLIDPTLHARGWTEDLIRREETAVVTCRLSTDPLICNLWFSQGRLTE